MSSTSFRGFCNPRVFRLSGLKSPRNEGGQRKSESSFFSRCTYCAGAVAEFSQKINILRMFCKREEERTYNVLSPPF